MHSGTFALVFLKEVERKKTHTSVSKARVLSCFVPYFTLLLRSRPLRSVVLLPLQGTWVWSLYSTLTAGKCREGTWVNPAIALYKLLGQTYYVTEEYPTMSVAQKHGTVNGSSNTHWIYSLRNPKTRLMKHFRLKITRLMSYLEYTILLAIG